jgi:hypothetical protein
MAVPKKPSKVTYNRFNYEKATELAKSQAMDANTQALAAQAVGKATQLGQNVQGLGQAAALGGQFVDTSAASGYQSPVTGQYTGMLKRAVVNPIKAEDRGVRNLINLRKQRKYREALMSKEAKGTTAVRSGILADADTTTTTSPRRIL